ncbi:MAG: class II aldolase/adducin family protein [Deltaproteobacteria bacterium]|nr:class II aldolase/adducin family protein [Deltaproteobacteria bacterium]
MRGRGSRARPAPRQAGGVEDDLRAQVAFGMRMLAAEGIFEYNVGHLSARTPQGDTAYIVGHLHGTGRTLDQVVPEDIIAMDFTGKTVEGKSRGPGERFIHTELYKLRPDVGAVVHAHPPLATAFSIAGVEILPVNHRGTIFHPRVEIFEDPRQIDTPALAAEVAKAMGDGFAILLRGHGCVCAGATVQEACVTVLSLEKTAWLQLMASVVGKPRPIPVEFTDGRFIQGLERHEFFANPWDFYVHKHGGDRGRPGPGRRGRVRG